MRFCYGQILPEDEEQRKQIPLATGLLDFFPGALAEVAKVSGHYGRTKHKSGDSLCWDSGGGQEHADCLLRHLVDRGYVDENGLRHSACVAWRALALLQQELEVAGECKGRASRDPRHSHHFGRPSLPDTHNELEEEENK